LLYQLIQSFNFTLVIGRLFAPVVNGARKIIRSEFSGLWGGRYGKIRIVATLGGFLGRKGAGEPSTQTLWFGLQRLEW
jgi:hypothetical protein